LKSKLFSPSLWHERTSTHPLIVNIHGGPHGQNGPSFNFKNQVYAARGWATLNVNFRGSTGYGRNSPMRFLAIKTATKARMFCMASARRCGGICGSIASAWALKA